MDRNDIIYKLKACQLAPDQNAYTFTRAINSGHSTCMLVRLRSAEGSDSDCQLILKDQKI